VLSVLARRFGFTFTISQIYELAKTHIIMSESKRASNILCPPFLKSGAGSDEDIVHPVSMKEPTARTHLNKLFADENIQENVTVRNRDVSIVKGVKIDAHVSSFTRLEARHSRDMAAMEARMEARMDARMEAMEARMEATEARHSREMTNMKTRMEATEARHLREMADMRARTDVIQANVAQLGATVLGRFDRLSTQIGENFHEIRPAQNFFAIPPAPQNDLFSNKMAFLGGVQDDVHAVTENVRQDFCAFGTDGENLQ
jgi:hypothetical protein